MARFIVDGKVKSLRMGDEIDWSADFIGNTNHGMEFDEDGNFVVDEVGFEWWKEMLTAWEKMQEAIDKYKEKYVDVDVDGFLEEENAWECDLEDQPASVLRLLAELDD